MAEPQGGGGLPVTTHEAILLCLLGYEAMAANYSSDCDCDEERQARVERGELVTCCWDGISLDEIDSNLEFKDVYFHPGRPTRVLDGFDFGYFEHLGPFEVWDERVMQEVEMMREASRRIARATFVG